MSLSNKPDPHYKDMLKFKLKGKDPLVINGSITGRSYIFKNTGDINWVDRRDVDDFEFNKDIISI